MFCFFCVLFLREDGINILQEENMNRKLYVGGLPFSVTDEQLEELFAQHGTVESARVISDRFTVIAADILTGSLTASILHGL